MTVRHGGCLLAFVKGTHFFFGVKHLKAELLNGEQRNRKKSQVVKSTRKVTFVEELTICVRNDAEVVHARFVVSFFARVFQVEGTFINIHHPQNILRELVVHSGSLDAKNPTWFTLLIQTPGKLYLHIRRDKRFSISAQCNLASPVEARNRVINAKMKFWKFLAQISTGGVFFFWCELLLTGNKTKNEESDSSWFLRDVYGPGYLRYLWNFCVNVSWITLHIIIAFW